MASRFGVFAMQRMHIRYLEFFTLVKLAMYAKNQGEREVKELAQPFRGSGRNITMDNYFTSLPLAEHLFTMLQNSGTSQDGYIAYFPRNRCVRTELDCCRGLSCQFKSVLSKISQLSVTYRFTSRYGY